MRHFFDLSDVRDIERAEDCAERTPRRNANTYAERKRWRESLVDRNDDTEVVS